MQRRLRGKTSDLNVTGLISLIQIFTSFISLGQHRSWAKTCVFINISCTRDRIFFKGKSWWRNNITKSNYFWIISNIGTDYLHKGGWIPRYLETWPWYPFAFLVLGFSIENCWCLCSFSTTSTPTSLHHKARFFKECEKSIFTRAGKRI